MFKGIAGNAAQLNQIFRESGLLLHLIDRHSLRGSWMVEALRGASLVASLPVQTDCGRWCSAMSLLTPEIPLVTFSNFMPGSEMGAGLLFAANHPVWDLVQCAAPTDSTTVTRTCCGCSDPNLCHGGITGDNPSGYCDEPCTSETCKQLAAGCGMSTHDIPFFHEHGYDCSVDDIKGGRCDLCRGAHANTFCDDFPAP